MICICMKEMRYIRFFFEQRPLLKHILPIETLGGPPPPKGDPMFELKQLPDI